VYDTMDSIGSAEQKTREDIDTTKSDYQAMLNGLSTGTAILARRKYAYDNVDISAIINAQSVHPLINNNDWGHKNYYMFRDTLGTGEWSVLPWDQDLSSGHTWQQAQSYFNDEIDSQRGLQNGAGNRLRTLVYSSPEMNRMFVRRMRTLMDEFYVSGTSTTGFYETRVPEIMDQIDPLDLAPGVKSDQRLDFEKWGFWIHGGGGSPIPFTDARSVDHTIRAQAARVITANPIPPQVGFTASAAQGNNTTFVFVNGRRRYLYNLDNQNPGSGGVPIPQAQPVTPSNITFETVDFNPASGNGEEEYFIIKNGSGDYVDVSGWRVTGAGGATTDVVDYVFRGGTVIPPFTSGSAFDATGDVHIGRLHVARNPANFRARAVSPKGGEYRYVVGPYNGHLSARGGALELRNKANDIVASTTWAPAPTAAQSTLRVTELNYNPTAPTAAEAQALAGVTASNFEFIELTNTGATPLDLGGAQFDKGVTFTFPAGFTLNGGDRCVVVGNQAAFQLRFGTSFNVAGEFEGNLDNNGETIRLLDAGNEEVFEFRYNPDWYGLPDAVQMDGIGPAAGYSFVTRSSAPEYDSYENPLTWALSRPADGTPGASDTAYSNVYYGWLHDHFTVAEQATAIATPGEDPDSDGTSNFGEYVYGGDPRVANAGALLSRAMVTVGSDQFPAVRFNARAGTLDVTWTVEASSDGVTWRTLGNDLASRVSVNPDQDELTIRDSEVAGPGTRIFRVKARYLNGYETTALSIENHAPAPAADTAAVRTEAVIIPVLFNDSDADNDTLLVRSVGSAAHGSAVANGDGSITYTPDGTLITAGGDSFIYIVSDALGGDAERTVTITIANVAPVAVPDQASSAGGSVTISVLANDTDTDGDSLSVTGVTQGQHGIVTVNAGTSVTFTPDASFAAATGDLFTYTIADGYGGTATGTVTVTSSNAPPVANDDIARVHTGPNTILVLENDTDANGNTLTISATTNGAHGAVSISGNSVIYTANATFTGTDTFTYTITDGLDGTDTAEVKVVNELQAAPTGVYRGLVTDNAQASVGIAEVRLSGKGRFTGQVWHLGERYTAKGQFDANGAANLTFRTQSGSTRTVTLQLAAEDDQVSGTVNGGATTAALTLKRFTATFGRGNPCPQSGAYTALMPTDPGHVGEEAYPQGCGYATMAVSITGKVKIGGHLGDDSRFVVRGAVDQDGIVLMNAPLYKSPKGFICGETSFVSGDAEADQKGVLTWRKPVQQKGDSSYAAGFSGSTAWQAARYTKLAKGAPIFGPGVSSATLTMEFGGLAAPVTKTVAITAQGLSVQNTGSDAVTMAMNPANGLFSGSYVHPRDSQKRSLGGVLYQKQTLGRGLFNGISDSRQAVTGEWMLAPSP